MSAADEVWEVIAPVHRRILGHPFVRGLTDGTLPGDAFARYVVQDALFLADYARALALCGARAPGRADVDMFCRHASEAVAVENALHDRLLGELGVSPEDMGAASPSPTCLAYTSFLLSSCALADWPEAVGAVLPCYWIYWEVGKELARAGSPDPRYAAWIATYGGEEFGDAARAAIGAADRALTDAGPAARRRAHARALTAARLEWRFWDAALRDERWLPPGD
ncbi:MAG: TenA family protein [Actinomycetota bacterium]